jgi:hypothetical protein
MFCGRSGIRQEPPTESGQADYSWDREYKNQRQILMSRGYLCQKHRKKDPNKLTNIELLSGF